MKSSSKSRVQRRTFILKAGAALSGTLAAAATASASKPIPAVGTAPDEQVAHLAHQVGMLEDANAIRQLHRAFGTALNLRRPEDAARLFASGSAARWDYGVVNLLDAPHGEDVVEVARDRRTATARFHCLQRVERAIPSSAPLVEMARLQGQGHTQWWETGLYESSCVKLGSDWKIQELRYRALAPADAPLR